MKYICMALIRFYRRFLSPLKPAPTCRFTPTCSAYALEAFEKRGFFAGFALTVWRILRCSPLSPCGYDPVPETGFRTMPMRWSKYERPPRDPDNIVDDEDDEDDEYGEYDDEYDDEYDEDEYDDDDDDCDDDEYDDEDCDDDSTSERKHESVGAVRRFRIGRKNRKSVPEDAAVSGAEAPADSAQNGSSTDDP